MINSIQEQFNRVIAYSQSDYIFENEINTNDLFSKWEKAKERFIKKFDGKLIYEFPEKVSFTLNEKEKKDKLNSFVNSILNTYENDKLCEFLESQSDGFYSNEVVKEYENEEIKVPKGMKLVKAFKYFEKDKYALEDIQNGASRLIQENKVEGTLCFSVHPLDYLSLSENTYKWRSCHALDGDYRSGNLSYMVDNSTVICYLKGEDEVKLPGFPADVPWNSKKWRMLLYFSDDGEMVFAGRQYPFASSDTMLDLIKTLLPFKTSNWWDNRYVNSRSFDVPLEHSYIPIRGRLYPMTEIVHDNEYTLHYNDLLRSSCYTEPYYLIKNNFPWDIHNFSLPQFHIGEEVKCLKCGTRPLTNSESMVCDQCISSLDLEDVGYCESCGKRITSEEEVYWVNDYPICENCYETECFICDACGQVAFNTDKKYDKERNGYICYTCSLEEE